MATLTLPVQSDGLICDVLVELDGPTTTALATAAKPILAPILCRGLIDTVTDITCVNSPVLRRLGLNTPSVQATTQTFRGTAHVDLFEVSVNVLNLSVPSGPKLIFPTLRIMEPPSPLTNLDVIIGLDVLLTARLFLDGPQREFTLEF
jgi:hypothetical protein